jgi:hypothetical protein
MSVRLLPGCPVARVQDVQNNVPADVQGRCATGSGLDKTSRYSKTPPSVKRMARSGDKDSVGGLRHQGLPFLPLVQRLRLYPKLVNVLWPPNPTTPDIYDLLRKEGGYLSTEALLL